MHDDLREPCSRAVDAGMDYLSRTIGPDGGWPSTVYHVHAPLSTETHNPPFVAGNGILALAGCRHPEVAEIQRRTRQFLHDAAEPGELWRYAHFLQPDADDTAICSMATGPHADALANVDAILGQRDDEGRFLTWLPIDEDPMEIFNEADAVVNANVVAYLGDRPETRAAQHWLAELVLESPDEIEGALHYYHHPLDLDVALARASDLQAPTFAELRQPVLERILASQAADGTFIDIMRTGQALAALDRLGALQDHAEVARPAVTRILQAQRADGCWLGCVAWVGGPGFPFVFESRTLTTACCIDALERVTDGPSG